MFDHSLSPGILKGSRKYNLHILYLHNHQRDRGPADLKTFRPQTFRLSDLPLPGWWNGRHAGLKIQWAVMPVRVQVPLRVPRGTRGQNRPLVSFYDILKPSLFPGMRWAIFFKERVATFNFWKCYFL